LFSRQTNRYHFLAIAAAIILSLNPYSLLDPGFQLSFAAVIAIFLVAPVFAMPLAFLPPMLREVTSISAATGLVTAPITLFHFHQASMVTVPANIAAAPVAAPVMLLGVLSVLVSPISSDICWILNAAGAACTGYLITMARLFASLPFAVYTGNSPGLLAMILFYGMLGGIVMASRKFGFTAAAVRLKEHRRLALALVLLLVLLAGFACLSSSPAHPPSNYTVSFFDVGQGDAVLIQVPGGATVLIDGGPGSSVLDRLKESGVAKLDAVILTHPHADHLAGLISTLKKYEVDTVYDGGSPSASPLYRDFLKEINEKHIRYQTVRRGQTILYGDLELKIYNPTDNQPPDDANANSVVIIARYQGLDILCPGDAEGEVLAGLDLPHVQVYKVPHHGSRDSLLKQVLSRIKPDIAVISVGEHNDYGHPAEDTLTKLREAGSVIFRTDRQGTIRISKTDNGVNVSTDR
jgi:competence protein ComEC